MMTRRALSGMLAAASIASAMPGAPDARADEGPQAPIQALDDALIASMKAGSAKTGFAARAVALTPVIERAFDLSAILQACVGPRWAGLPAAQRTQLLDDFTSFTVATYAANFSAFSGETIEILPNPRAVGADRVVATRLTPSGGDPVRIDYVMHSSDAGAWRAVDVLLDGSISRVAVQRSDFRSLLAEGDAAPLIAMLQRKTAELSGGAPPT